LKKRAGLLEDLALARGSQESQRRESLLKMRIALVVEVLKVSTVLHFEVVDQYEVSWALFRIKVPPGRSEMRSMKVFQMTVGSLMA